jgi:glycine oxidase
MSQKAKASWRMEDALKALDTTIALANATLLLSRDGILRPATDAKQAEVFCDVAATLPDDAVWLPAAAIQERFPHIVAPSGGLLVRRGGALSVPAFVKAMLTAAQQQGTHVATNTEGIGWQEDHHGAYVEVRHEQVTTRLQANRIILALGYGYHSHKNLNLLNLHPIKGQTVRVARPTPSPNLPLAGQGYIVPEGDTLVVGSSYERDFNTLHPSAEQTRLILEMAASMVPALRDATVLEATAGVRVTVPGTRLPMLGPLPGHQRIWIFTGLGSKGLLMAPLLAQHLPAYLEDPATIPPKVRVTLAK